MNWRFPLITFLLLSNLLTWSAVLAADGGLLRISFLGVGQGDATLIEAPNGNQLLIDGGQRGSLMAPLSAELPFYDRTIEVVLATHPDADHIGGLSELMRRYKVEAFIDPGNTTDKNVQADLVAAVADEKSMTFVARRGMRVWLDSNVVFEVLYPDRDVSAEESNDASIVGKLYYGQTSFLLTGDAPVKVEEYLARLDGTRLDVDVLKVGHHGSKTSTSQNLLKLTTPEFAVVSAGKNNRYGHPHSIVLSLLDAENIKVLRTDRDGTITLLSNGKQISRR